MSYSALAREYYSSSHKTCRNFDAATKAALAKKAIELPQGKLLLEVGCGKGRIGEYLNAPSAHVVQLDATAEMLALAPREDCLLRIHADATSVPLCDEQFGAVVGFLIDPFIGLCFFAEALRLLEKGGLFVATTPAAEWGLALRGSDDTSANAATFKTADNRAVTVPSTLFSKERLKQMLAYSGFEHVAVQVEALPAGTAAISPDVETAAKNKGVGVHELPLVYLMIGRKPL